MKTAVLVALLALTSPAAGQGIIGQATVIDGDTLEIHGQRIRLWGIDAPESAQLCRGSDSKPFRCGSAAALALSDHIGGHTVTCSPKATDRYRRTVAICFVGDVELARWLVGLGLAIDWPHYSHGAYSADQANASSSDAGIWAGSFIEPWKFRDCIRSGGRLQECSDGD